MQVPSPVTDPAEVARIARRIKKCDRVTFDTESDSLYHYREKVCLMQIAAGGEAWLIDTLAVKDLSVLAPIFASKKIQKVLHGADYDIACLKRDYNFEFANLFDTMIAAQLLGLEGWGFGALARSELGVALQKQSQRSDWSTRPLPEKMLRYALDDVIHLEAIRDKLAARLEQAGRMPWLIEECDVLCRRGPSSRASEKQNGFLKIKGAKALPRRDLAVLREVCRVRERRAGKLDRPPFKVIGNGSLLEIARRKPRDYKALLKIKGVSKLVAERLAEGLLEAVAKGASMPEDKLPTIPKPPIRPKVPGMLGRIDRLRAWRTAAARRMNMDAGVLLSQNLIKAISAASPRDKDALAKIENLRQWRIDAFGDELIDALELKRSTPRAASASSRSKAIKPDKKTGRHASGD